MLIMFLLSVGAVIYLVLLCDTGLRAQSTLHKVCGQVHGTGV